MAGSSWLMGQGWAAGRAVDQQGHAARRWPGCRPEGGGRLGPVARRCRGCEPARSEWSSLPPPEGADRSASGSPLRKVSPTEPIMLRSWEMLIVPPGTVGPPSPGERNGNGEANRVDCVRTVHKHRNLLDHAPDALHKDTETFGGHAASPSSSIAHLCVRAKGSETSVADPK